MPNFITTVKNYQEINTTSIYSNQNYLYSYNYVNFPDSQATSTVNSTLCG